LLGLLGWLSLFFISLGFDMSHAMRFSARVPLSLFGVDIDLTNVEYYPPVDADDVSPGEPAIVIWDRAFVGGYDVTPLLNNASQGFLACVNLAVEDVMGD
jgi:hypothetical protein